LTAPVSFSRAVLSIDAASTAAGIEEAIRTQVLRELKRHGTVVALSGGIDSSVSVALAAAALGPERVFALLLPEQESSPESLRLGRLVAEQFGIAYAVEDITPVLEAAGCYARRDEAIRNLVPEYGPGYKCKVVLPDTSSAASYAVPSVVVQSSLDGRLLKTRLTAEVARAITAATNFKQRTRKMVEYYHADRLGYAVLGTPNRLEYDQGFFVKNGDGAADLKPLAHLYKSQVYQLAAHLGIPEEIQTRPPTTDTWPLEQSQEEFYFTLPYDQMDLCLYGKNNGIPPAAVAAALGLAPELIERTYRGIDSKRRATRYLHMAPLLVSE
jgi:NAD+ synthase